MAVEPAPCITAKRAANRLASEIDKPKVESRHMIRSAFLIAACALFLASRATWAAQEPKAEAPAAENAAHQSKADAHSAGGESGGHAAGHHDETDLSHGNATASLSSPADF